jgi:hypothetical protein
MNITIKSIADIGKLLGAIRLAAKGDVKIATGLLDEALSHLSRLAKENGISIKIVAPSGERLMVFTASGAIAGAAVGYIIGQLPGAVFGAVVGGALGYGAAHATLVMDRPGNGEYITLKLG